ncbi:Putative MFS transporter superfamily [Septoria linicola]|uniref:MFS transporter superfamily n=1 Tax=Septoria linicola TaxID=215465 RepID=A0A9Q9ELJ5_9PEZI|nr:Putative MFS transporter superfamily [Septoria linicola]
MVPYFITHGLVSALSAQLVVYLKSKGRRSYSLVMSSGFTIWTVAMALLGWECVAQIHHLVLAFGIFVGLGTGSVFQNSVSALSSAVDRDEEAVAVGTRNVVRFFGGALGTAISYAVLNADMRAHLPPELKYLAGGNLSTEGLSGEVKRRVQKAASKGL